MYNDNDDSCLRRRTLRQRCGILVGESQALVPILILTDLFGYDNVNLVELLKGSAVRSWHGSLANGQHIRARGSNRPQLSRQIDVAPTDYRVPFFFSTPANRGHNQTFVDDSL